MKKIFILFFLVISFQSGHSQVLISLILGDDLNSGKVEFGLDGGMNLSTLSNVNGKSLNSFNLGFYFDIKMKNEFMFHTGVIVKSRLGAGDLPVYSLGESNLDSSFNGGSVDRKLDYFNVPLMLKYKFKNHFFVETGIMLGLLYGAKDEFKNTVLEDELTYNVSNRKKYHPLDAGWMTGIGYRLMKGNGMNLGIRYYMGFVDITIDDSGDSIRNNSLYFTVGIPIGAGKAREKAKAKQDNPDKQ